MRPFYETESKLAISGFERLPYEGGIHVPCYVRWPGRFPAGLVVDQIAAHIDITPTLLDACELPAGTEPKLDGRSLLPSLCGDGRNLARTDVYLQWHRGDAPEPGRAFAARTQRFKLLRAEQQATRPQPPLELYDLEQDPFEQHDLTGGTPTSWPGCITNTWTGSASSARREDSHRTGSRSAIRARTPSSSLARTGISPATDRPLH